MLLLLGRVLDLQLFLHEVIFCFSTSSLILLCYLIAITASKNGEISFEAGADEGRGFWADRITELRSLLAESDFLIHSFELLCVDHIGQVRRIGWR